MFLNRDQRLKVINPKGKQVGEGHIEIREPMAKPGDYVVLHALDKLVVVVTACSVVGVVNGGEPRELLIEVYE